MSGLVVGCLQGSHGVTSHLTTNPRGSSSGSFKQRHGNVYACLAVPCQAWQIQGSRGHRQLTSRAVRPVVECSSTHGWGCASPVRCPLSSSSSMRDQQMPPSRPNRVCAAHAAAAMPAVMGNPSWPARQLAAARLRSLATSGKAREAATTAVDGTLHPASSMSDAVPSSSALPDDFWEERRKLLRSMRNERDPVNKRARFKAVRCVSLLDSCVHATCQVLVSQEPSLQQPCLVIYMSRGLQCADAPPFCCSKQCSQPSASFN
jgi:hypothetical protein